MSMASIAIPRRGVLPIVYFPTRREGLLLLWLRYPEGSHSESQSLHGFYQMFYHLSIATKRLKRIAAQPRDYVLFYCFKTISVVSAMLGLVQFLVFSLFSLCFTVNVKEEFYPKYKECTDYDDCGKWQSCQYSTYSVSVCKCQNTYVESWVQFNDTDFELKCLGTYFSTCDNVEDCELNKDFICKPIRNLDFNQCQCPEGMVITGYQSTKKCMNKVPIFGPCSFSEQCEAKDPFSTCRPDFGSSSSCQCKRLFKLVNGRCKYDNGSDSKTALEIYKITMIFASCCLALILLVFLGCVLRRSYCPASGLQLPLDNTVPDIFTLFPDGPAGEAPFNTQPPFEKPPTYDETIRLMREEIGVPPPAYTPQSGTSSPSSAPPAGQAQAQDPSQPSTSRDSESSQVEPSGAGDRNGCVNRGFLPE